MLAPDQGCSAFVARKGGRSSRRIFRSGFIVYIMDGKCWDEEMRDTKSRCGATLTPGLFLVQTVAAVNEVGRTLSVKLFEHGVCSRSLMVLNFSPDVILHPGREIWPHGIQSYSWR